MEENKRDQSKKSPTLSQAKDNSPEKSEAVGGIDNMTLALGSEKAEENEEQTSERPRSNASVHSEVAVQEDPVEEMEV
jgi:hypothetical protein